MLLVRGGDVFEKKGGKELGGGVEGLGVFVVMHEYRGGVKLCS
ncbi:hypothetical protein [Bartonella sp. TT119HLJHH]